MTIWLPVRGDELMPGMVVKRSPDNREKDENIGALSGRCEKGLHFGNGCYDRISTWWIKETVKL